MIVCWRCKSRFMPHPYTGNCFLCGYEQDIEHVEKVRLAKAIHDLTGLNPKTDGGDKSYRIKRNWSMED